MKLLFPALVFALICPLPCSQAQTAPEPSRLLPPIDVHFSPEGHCTEAVIKEIRTAQASVLVQAYWFTSAPIAKALVDAHGRGVKVEVILDKSRTDRDHVQADVLLQAGVPTLIDGKHVTAHNKLIITDGSVVITGSFNFTGQSEDENAENLLVIRDRAIAEKFLANWRTHAQHSVPYAMAEK